MLNKAQEIRLHKELNKQAEFNSRNNFGELSITDINRAYDNITEEDLK